MYFMTAKVEKLSTASTSLVHYTIYIIYTLLYSAGGSGAGWQGVESDRQHRNATGDNPRTESGIGTVEERPLCYHAIPFTPTGECCVCIFACFVCVYLLVFN